MQKKDKKVKDDGLFALPSLLWLEVNNLQEQLEAAKRSTDLPTHWTLLTSCFSELDLSFVAAKNIFIDNSFLWRLFITSLPVPTSSPSPSPNHPSAAAGQLAWLLTYETSGWLICRHLLIFLAAASLIAWINQTYWIINLFAWRWLIYLMASRVRTCVRECVRECVPCFEVAVLCLTCRVVKPDDPSGPVDVGAQRSGF